MVQRLKELIILDSSQFVSVRAHTVIHSSLSSLSKEEQQMEIKLSIETLENILGHDITTFSYQFGDYNDNTIEIVEALGIAKAALLVGVK